MVDFILNEEQQEYQKLAREFAQRQLAPNAHKYDIAAQPDAEILRQLWESGLASVAVPADYDGLGLGFWDTVIIIEELSAGCPGLSAPIEANIVALLTVLKGARDALKAQVCQRLTSEFSLLGPTGKGILTVSGGMAVYPYDGRTPEELIEAADRALMFGAKKHGKNSIFLVGDDSAVEQPADPA